MITTHFLTHLWGTLWAEYLLHSPSRIKKKVSLKADIRRHGSTCLQSKKNAVMMCWGHGRCMLEAMPVTQSLADDNTSDLASCHHCHQYADTTLHSSIQTKYTQQSHQRSRNKTIFIYKARLCVHPLPFDPKKCYFRFRFSVPLIYLKCVIKKSSPKVKHDLT